MFDWRVNSNQVRYANAFAGIIRATARTAAAIAARTFISDLLHPRRRRRDVEPRQLASGRDIEHAYVRGVLAENGDPSLVRADRDRAAVGEGADVAGAVGDKELQLFAETDAIEKEPVARPGIDDVMSKLRRPGHFGAVDVALDDHLSGIAATGSKVRIGSLDERDRAVLPPRRRVGASSQEEVLACVVVHPQRGSSENVAVGDPLLRERLFLVDRPQLLPGVVGDDVAVA